MKEYFDRFVKSKDDVFGILTTTLIYAIMLPMIFSENRKVEPRYIDLDVLFLHLKQMPMVLYYVIMMVMLATTVNFFRDILSAAKKYFESIIISRGNGYGQMGNSFLGVETGLRPVSTYGNINQFGNTTTYPPTGEGANPNTDQYN